MPILPVDDTAPVYRGSGKTRRISKDRGVGAIVPRTPNLES